MGARLGMTILALVVLFSCKGQSRLGLEYPKNEIEEGTE